MLGKGLQLCALESLRWNCGPEGRRRIGGHERSVGIWKCVEEFANAETRLHERLCLLVCFESLYTATHDGDACTAKG